MTRELPLLVLLAWDCLDSTAAALREVRRDRFCPLVEAARGQIRQWRRFRHVWGWR